MDISRYYISILCALPVELEAMKACCDDFYYPESTPDIDTSNYTFARIGKHAVILTSLHLYGNISSAAEASQVVDLFPNVRFCMLVGIGGGVPYGHSRDMHLGDVAVSIPGNGTSGFLHHDLGKNIQSVGFVTNSHVDKPPQVLLDVALSIGHGFKPWLGDQVSQILTSGVLDASFKPPPRKSDVLYIPSFCHPSSDSASSCTETCRDGALVDREPRTTSTPRIFHGTIASGDAVMKDTVERDRLAQAERVICFDMESAGVAGNMHAISIRGISDYSDSHKMKHWQGYAALTAACYAKGLLLALDPQALIPDLKTQSPPEYWLVPRPQRPTAHGYRKELQTLSDFARGHTKSQYLVVYGPSGSGKTLLVTELAHELRASQSVVWLKYPPTGSSSSVGIVELERHLDMQYTLPGTGAGLVSALAKIEAAQKAPWLLVVDDAADADEAIRLLDAQNTLLPIVHRRAVIITRKKFAAAADSQSQFPVQALHMNYLTPSAGEAFLRQALFENSLAGSARQNTLLVEHLQGIPLVVAQAAAYMMQTWTPVPELLDAVDDRRADDDLDFDDLRYCKRLYRLILAELSPHLGPESVFNTHISWSYPYDVPVSNLGGTAKSANREVNLFLAYNIAERMKGDYIRFKFLRYIDDEDMALSSAPASAAHDALMATRPSASDQGDIVMYLHHVMFRYLSRLQQTDAPDACAVEHMSVFSELFLREAAYAEAALALTTLRQLCGQMAAGERAKISPLRLLRSACDLGSAYSKMCLYAQADRVLQEAGEFAAAHWGADSAQAKSVAQRLKFVRQADGRHVDEESSVRDIKDYVPFHRLQISTTPQ